MPFFRPITLGIAVFALVFSGPSGAQLEPEAVYRMFHDATIAGDFNELRKWGTIQSGNELAAEPAEQRQAIIAFLGGMMPKSYAVTAKNVGADKATLRLCARASEQGKVTTLPGTVALVREKGAWKVLSTKWGGAQPPGPSTQQCPSPVEPVRRATLPGK